MISLPMNSNLKRSSLVTIFEDDDEAKAFGLVIGVPANTCSTVKSLTLVYGDTGPKVLVAKYFMIMAIISIGALDR